MCGRNVHNVNVWSLAPDEELRPLVEYYWSLGLNGKDIVSQVCDEIDLEQYGFRYVDLLPSRPFTMMITHRTFFQPQLCQLPQAQG